LTLTLGSSLIARPILLAVTLSEVTCMLFYRTHQLYISYSVTINQSIHVYFRHKSIARAVQ